MTSILHIDRGHNPPTLATEHGEAWECDLTKAREKAGTTDEQDPTVAAWIVFAPWSHPFWPYCAILAIHLRDVAGQKKPAHQYFPGATHEIFVAAIDPKKCPDVEKPGAGWLLPLNYAGQWQQPERPNPVDLDRGARAKVRSAVDDILAGKLNPDSDGLLGWIARFGNTNIKK